MEDKELLLEQYKIWIDLYKHNLDLVIKFNLFYYAITGALLSFYFTHLTLQQIHFSLLFPILMSLVFGYFFFYTAKRNKELSNEISKLSSKLNLLSYVDVNILTYLLRIFGGLYFIIAIGLSVIVSCHPLFESIKTK